jgi:ATP-dependent RNA helicase RhlE
MKFDELNLNRPLLNALEELGYVNPTTKQQKGFPVIMSGRDVVGIAQTGTGKTMAYLLPCLRQWEFSKNKVLKVLILVPTRELAVQVADVAKKLSTYMSVKVEAVYGGVNMKPQMALLSGGVDILVATPGRLVDLVLNGTVNLKTVKRLVIDEVDEMLGLGFKHQLTTILNLLPERKQNLMFSATITDDVEALIAHYFNGPVKIEAAPAGTPLDNIKQTGYELPNFYTKVNMLELLLADQVEFKKVLVFAATKKLADQLYEQIGEKFKGQVGVIHSNKSQNNRFDTVKKFQSGEYRVLIATDIIARGLDIAEVSHVINFDTPDEAENYIHRIGRTGRADKEGISITFITPKEEPFKVAIETLMNTKIPLQATPPELEIVDKLTQDEMPKNLVMNIQDKFERKEKPTGAFHEKSEKNKKVNAPVSRGEKLKLKYGKPKTRGQKKKK